MVLAVISRFVRYIILRTISGTFSSWSGHDADVNQISVLNLDGTRTERNGIRGSAAVVILWTGICTCGVSVVVVFAVYRCIYIYIYDILRTKRRL